jgi:hypothetical protein
MRNALSTFESFETLSSARSGTPSVKPDFFVMFAHLYNQAERVDKADMVLAHQQRKVHLPYTNRLVDVVLIRHHSGLSLRSGLQ